MLRTRSTSTRPGRLATLTAIAFAIATPSVASQEPVLVSLDAAASARQEFSGWVTLPDGAPAAGAVVVTSAGGRAVADAGGRFELAVDVPLEAGDVHVTAVASGGRWSGSLVASARVAPSDAGSRISVGRLALAATSSCQPSWLPTFDAQPGLGGSVRALAVFDDGTGPALYVGGWFSTAGSVTANKIARWDGSTWSALGSGVSGGQFPVVNALDVFDDGSGPALFVGGSFTNAGGVPASRIAKWDGATWSALGSGLSGSAILDLLTVNALTVFDDGLGPALYAAGDFTTAGGTPAKRVARWDGSSWSPLGHGLSSWAAAFATFDDGGGDALYVGGQFATAGGTAVNGVAKWDGSTWSALGSGTSGQVLALAVHDDGSGPALFAGGAFTFAGGIAAERIAKWDGSAWSTVGGGFGNAVIMLSVYDDGGGPQLYAGGDFTSAGGLPASHVARWNGSQWAAVAEGINGAVWAMEAFDGGSGVKLFAGGTFSIAGAVPANSIAAWGGSSWSPIGTGLNRAVYALADFDDGTGPALYAGGDFTGAGGFVVNRIAKWAGSSWSPVGTGMDSIVEALATFDDGSGPALYAGGFFTTAGGASANRVARWDGASWSALGSGVNSYVRALGVFDDGGGPALYAGGHFTIAGGVPAMCIAKWDGSSWSALGNGTSGQVYCFAVFDDGTGPALYAGGNFMFAGTFLARSVAKWDGSAWSVLGLGIGGSVDALAVFDDGGGPALFVAGEFSSAGGAPAASIAKWDGTSWSTLGSGVGGGGVMALQVFDSGGGPALHVAGEFTSAGGLAANGFAKWDGSSWTALGGGLSGGVYGPWLASLADFDDGVGPSLYAGGSFTVIASGDAYIAKWGCPTIASVPGCATNPATLTAFAPTAPLGKVLSLHITAVAATTGLGHLYFGGAGTDASGCGLLLPGLGELLISAVPAPYLLASAALGGGVCHLSFLVPAVPAYVGLTAHVQGAALDFAQPQPIELTNGLAVKLGP